MCGHLLIRSVISLGVDADSPPFLLLATGSPWYPSNDFTICRNHRMLNGSGDEIATHLFRLGGPSLRSVCLKQPVLTDKYGGEHRLQLGQTLTVQSVGDIEAFHICLAATPFSRA